MPNKLPKDFVDVSGSGDDDVPVIPPNTEPTVVLNLKVPILKDKKFYLFLIVLTLTILGLAKTIHH